MTRHTLVLVLAVSLSSESAAWADEADDALSRRLSAQVRDFRLPLPARVEAARTIGKLGARGAASVPDLTTVLDRLRGTELAPLQEAIIETLGQIGASARPALPALARSTYRTADIDLAVRQSTDLILLAADTENLELLRLQLASLDPSIRLRATKALADLGPGAKSVIPTLLITLGDQDADVRHGAIAALRAILPTGVPPPEVIRAIARDLTSPDATSRLIAARDLGRIGPAALPVAPLLEPLRGDPDPDVRRAAAEALGRIGPPP